MDVRDDDLIKMSLDFLVHRRSRSWQDFCERDANVREGKEPSEVCL